MSTIPQKIGSAFAVFFGRYGDVTKMAQDREQSRQSLYREAETVVEAVDGAATQAQIDDLKRQLADRQAEVNALQERLKHAVEITPDKQHEFATVAQAEGVSLSVARRLLRVVTPRHNRAVATLGRATLEAGTKAGALLDVLDEVARPEVKQGTADEIFFWPHPRPDGRRAREPLLGDRADGQGPRRRHMGGGIRPISGAQGRGPG